MMPANIQEWFDSQGGEGSGCKNSKKKGVVNADDIEDLLMDGVIDDMLEIDVGWDKSKNGTKKRVPIDR